MKPGVRNSYYLIARKTALLLRRLIREWLRVGGSLVGTILMTTLKIQAIRLGLSARHICATLTDINIKALLINEDLADQIWELWGAGARWTS